MIHEQINQRYQELISSRNQAHGLNGDDNLLGPVMRGDSPVEYSDLNAYCESLNDKSRIYVQRLREPEANMISFLCNQVTGDFGADKGLKDIHAIIPEARFGLYIKEKKELESYGLTGITYEQAVLLQFIQTLAFTKSFYNKQDDWYLALVNPIKDAFSKVEDFEGFSKFKTDIQRKSQGLDFSKFLKIVSPWRSAIPTYINEKSQEKLKDFYNGFLVYRGRVLGGIDSMLDNLESHFLGFRGSNQDPRSIIDCGNKILEACIKRVKLAQQWREEVLEGLEKFVLELGDQLFKVSGVAKRIFDDYNSLGLIKSLGLERTYKEILDQASV